LNKGTPLSNNQFFLLVELEMGCLQVAYNSLSTPFYSLILYPVIYG
jgi:hypothetical protein